MSQTETKKCQNCKKDFVIDSEDFSFYEKMSVPAPTFCSECRLKRRLSYRNERSLYKDKCDLCGENMISMYSSQSPYVVYCKKCWWSDKWSQLEFGQEYDFDKPFLKQFFELRLKVPRLGLMQIKDNVNSEYANYIGHNKNVYLCFSALGCENTMYSRAVDYCRDTLDCSSVARSEESYECIESGRISKCRFCFRVGDSIDCAFLYDCANCQNCFMSTGLRNKQYVFRNKQLTKDEYKKEMEKIDYGAYDTIEKLKSEFSGMKMSFINKYANILKSVDSTGDNQINCKSVKMSFDIYDSEDLKYCARVVNTRQCYDVYGIASGELAYEGVGMSYDSYKMRSGIIGDGMRETHYTDSCFEGTNLIGCISLRKKANCILNKQYTKEEYNSLSKKIIEHMSDMPFEGNNDRSYSYGEYFPTESSIFCYNETLAQEYFPISKSEAADMGYMWKDQDVKEFGITKQPLDLPDNIVEIDNTILKEIIGCMHEGKCKEQCTTAFKVTPQELKFYKQMNIPIPRLCPNCRHYQRLGQRNSLKVWDGKCQCAGTNSENKIYSNTSKSHQSHVQTEHCPNKFLTPYAPDSRDIVYCEQCYQAEVL